MAATACSPGDAEPCSIDAQRSRRSRSSCSERSWVWLCSDCGGFRRAIENELTVRGVDPDVVAGRELALEQCQRELVDQLALDHALEWARAVSGVVAEVADQLLRIVGQLDLDAALGDALAQPVDLQPDDVANLVALERVELHDLVKAVHELRLEVRLDAH